MPDDIMNQILAQAIGKKDGTYKWDMNKSCLVSANEKTDLEKILSNLAHDEVRLIDYKQEAKHESGSSPEYEFHFSAIPDKHIPDEEIPFCEKDCSECDICQEECFDCEIDDDDDCFCWGIPDIQRIIFNPPATIIFWDDGTKTVVKCMKDQPYEKYAGFAAACLKKMFGSTSRAKAIMELCDDELVHPKKVADEPEKPKTKPKTINVEQLINAFVSGIKQAAEEKEKKDATPAE